MTPASGRQDHTALPSALMPLVSASPRRPSHPASTFVTIAKRPSYRGGTRESVELICPTAQAKYFWPGDWTTQITLNRLSKFRFARMRFGKPKGVREADPSQMMRLI
ncbi:MAG: hypothetical protein E6G70_30425 [Alphaproteobacteria bacterium]|nr:MAG: hypothetical protein E6G70_30425 [Alphaproteobacteria bacterium]